MTFLTGLFQRKSEPATEGSEFLPIQLGATIKYF